MPNKERIEKYEKDYISPAENIQQTPEIKT
jgi:hypothetical protein